MNGQCLHPRIEVCGGIASGKTSFVVLLSKLRITTGLENFSNNPFLVDFYDDSPEFAFETEITFVLQHYNTIKKHAKLRTLAAFDFSLALDLAYAGITLRKDDRETFDIVYQAVAKKIGLPLLIVRLRCSPDEELLRIRRRARQVERRIGREYLQHLDTALDRVLASTSFSNTAVLEIDSQRTDFVTNPAAIVEVCQKIKARLDGLGQHVHFDHELVANAAVSPTN